MKYSVGDRVKIVADGWGCADRIGQTGVIESVYGRDYAILMDDGSYLTSVWEQGFDYADDVRDFSQPEKLIDALIPDDWQNPDWEARTKVHDWKNYVETTFLEDIWETFDDNQKKVLAYNFQIIADNEEWG